ncbi:tetratricopeptide repeat protein [Actinokineospora inagensis]|uniref:tetratricopeptide repeat protein n=1 Tax=Actinokineospora inagensis TaxID=103730 RepID=UPI0004230BB4|nr:tetratricopeptide repeat protein [Actinokineospora inagensis]
MSIEPLGPPGEDRRSSRAVGRSVTTAAPTVQGTLVQAERIESLTLHVAAGMPIPVPRQIPAPIRDLLARDRELSDLDELAGTPTCAQRPRVLVVSGMSGVGKTTVSTQWAWLNRSRFAGGQLFADLSAYRRRGGVATADVLGGFLRALGVHEQFIPTDLASRAALFRSRTADAPVLVVLDNADQAAQVRPFVPGAAGSVVLVTSQHKLSGLVVDGASTLALRPLDADESYHMLVDDLPDQVRAALPREDVAALIDLCGGLPLALRIAAARLAEAPRWTAQRLRDYLSDRKHRLGRLAVGGHAVRTVFDATVANLQPRFQTLYRRLGLHPGPEFSVAAAATVSGLSVPDTADALEHLFEANLVEATPVDETTPVDGLRAERFRFHDLVRLHAQALADHDEPADERESILDRITAWYLAGARAADTAVVGAARWRSTELVTTDWTGPEFTTAATAVDWWELERQNLLESVRTADRRGDARVVLAFCEALWPFWHDRKHHADWVEAHVMGVRAAVRLGDDVAETRTRNQLARAHVELGQFDQAAEQLDLALAAAHRSAEPRAVAVVRESLGVLHRDREQWQESIVEFERSLRINEEVADDRGVALQLYHLADVLVRAHDPHRAITLLDRAATLAKGIGDDLTTARVDIILGAAYQQLDEPDRARSALERAVTTTRERGQPVKEAEALRRLVTIVGPDSPESAEFRRRLRGLTGVPE